MLAAQFTTYGEPEVLEVAEVPEPHAGRGEVRVAVRAASLNCIDYRLRAGELSDTEPAGFPVVSGYDAAGVVDEVGAGVADVQVGDEVFGLGHPTQAELAVLQSFVMKPDSLDWAEAAAIGLAGVTSVRVLDLLGIGMGSTVLIDGGTGGVGSLAIQVAVARGATVLATGGLPSLYYLDGLGAKPIESGDGMLERVADAAPHGVDAVFDVVGTTPITELVKLVSDPAQVVSIANVDAPEHGARVARNGEGSDPVAALREVADLAATGQLTVEVQSFPLGEVAEAHKLAADGPLRGKLVLVL